MNLLDTYFKELVRSSDGRVTVNEGKSNGRVNSH